MDEKKVTTSAFTEVGSTGRSQWGTPVSFRETDAELRGRAAVRLYGEMRRDHNGSAMFQVLTLPIRGVTWRSEAASEDEADQKAATHLWDCLEDMGQSFPDMIADATTMFPFGWAFLEMVLKRRDNGTVGFKKIALRPQHTLQEWLYDEDGDIEGMRQMTGKGGDVSIPLDRSLLFRTSREGDDPEGMSAFRAAVRPYKHRMRFEQIEGTGLYRRWAGFPTVFMPPGATTKADLGEKSDEAMAERFVEAAYLDKLLGGYFPHGWEFKLGGPEGTVDATLSDTIIRKDAEAARSILAQFLLLGLKAVGTQALATTLLDSFILAIEAYLEIIAGIMNRYLVPYLFQWYVDPALTGLPKLRYSSPRKLDLTALGRFLTALTRAGGLTMDEKTENFLRSVVPGMPEAPPKEDGETPKSARPESAEPDDETGAGGDKPPPPSKTEPDQAGMTWLAYPKASGGRAAFQAKLPPDERSAAYHALADENAAAQRAGLENWTEDTARQVASMGRDVTHSDLRAKLDDLVLVALLMFRERSVLDIGAAFWLGFGAPSGPPSSMRVLEGEISLADEWIGYGLGGALARTNPAGRPTLFGDIQGTLEGRLSAILLLLKGGREDDVMVEIRQAVRSATQGFARAEKYSGHVWRATWVGAHEGSETPWEAIRWALDVMAQHCEDCPRFGADPPGREYANWDAMLQFTGGILPGPGTECRGFCRCDLYVLRQGEWVIM